LLPGNILKFHGPYNYPFAIGNTFQAGFAVLNDTPESFMMLPYNPGSIVIETLDSDLVKGSIDARMYSTVEGFWEEVDTVFLTISGIFEARLHRVEK
jgi:hypothetical protein